MTFYTEEKDGDYTLNVLELSSSSFPRTFKNSYHDSDRYSLDGKHLVFITDEKDDGYTLNVLELGSSSPPRALRAIIGTNTVLMVSI